MLIQNASPDTLQSALRNLHDIQEPAPVSAWPPAPGWWILIAAVAVLLVWMTLRGRHRIRAFLWQWHWLRQLPAPQTEPGYFTRLNRVLKDAAQRRWPDQRPLTLTGETWIVFLQNRAPDLDPDSIADLVHNGLRPTPNMTPEAADRLARQWLRRQSP